MTVPDTCPECSAELGGLGKCQECEYDHRKVGRGDESAGEVPEPTEAEVQHDPAPREWDCTLPWELLTSVNQRSGGMVGWTSKEYREKRDAMAAWIQNEYGGAPHAGEVCVQVELYPPNKRADPHNFTKAIFDALELAGVVKDDRLITRWIGTQFYVDKDNPRAYLKVEKREAVEAL